MKQHRIVGLGNWHDYYSYFLYGIMEGTILNGHLFRPVPLFGQTLNQVFEQILWFKPQLVICHMIFNKQPHDQTNVLKMLRKIRAHGIKVAYHAGDARSTPRYEANISPFVDFALCNHDLMKKYSEIWGVPCYYWPYACLNQNGFIDPTDEFRCKVAFAGSLEEGSKHHQPRAQFVKSLKQVIDIKTFPTPESGNTRFQTATLSQSAECILGFQMGLDIPGYLDVRPFQYIGAGALYFHDNHPNMNKVFIPGVHYVSFERDNVNDFVRKYIHYVENFPEQGMAIKKTGFDYCQKYHSYKERMAAVISLIEGKGYYIHALNDKHEIIKVNNPWKN
jgi:hypothetical protein